MKKIFLLLAAIICFSGTYGQTLQPTATVTSGEEVVLTVSGETSSRYMTGIQIILPLSVITPAGTSVVTTAADYAGYPYPVGSQTKFKFTITGTFNSSSTISAKLKIRCTIFNPSSGSTNEDQDVTITVNKPVQTSFPNQLRSQTFYKNDCGPGFSSDPYVYSVPAGTYTASSQSAANALADADISTNGQNLANANRTCKQIYYNAQASATFIKNNCVPGFVGSSIIYTVTANKYQSLISQADADLKATNDLNTNGQNYANSSGTCTCAGAPPAPDFLSSTYNGKSQLFLMVNKPQGSTSINWYLDGIFWKTTTTGQTVITLACGISKSLGIESVNECGTSIRTIHIITGCESESEEFN